MILSHGHLASSRSSKKIKIEIRVYCITIKVTIVRPKLLLPSLFDDFY